MWSQTPAADLSIPGPHTVTLTPCPTGVFVNAVGYTPTIYVYVAGNGIPEASRATLVSGHSGDSSCQISITTVNAHLPGYTVSSASGGIKEASEAARVPVNNQSTPSTNGGSVIIDPAGSPYKVYAPLHFEASWQDVQGFGGHIDCYVSADDCIVVGQRTGQSVTQNVVLDGLIITAANGNLVNFPFDAIHVNAQTTVIRNPRIMYSGAGATPNGSFNSYVSVCDDESFTLDGLDVFNGQGLRNDRRGQAVYALAEGDPRNTNNCFAVGWLRSINGNLQCAGNVVRWLSGNGLRVSDTVIQGFSQFGILTGTPTGGFNGNTQIDNSYFEVGSCTNPDYVSAGASGGAAAGEAGVITQGGTVYGRGSTGFTGSMPTFACSGTAGSNQINYWLVANQTGAAQGNGMSGVLFIGRTPTNCSGTVTVYRPNIPAATGGTVTVDILRTVGAGGGVNIPFLGGCGGGSATACGSVATGITQSGAAIESFTDDTSVATASYIFATTAFVPYLPFWPGNLVLSASAPSNRTQVPVASFQGEQNLAGGNGVGVVSVNGNLSPSTYNGTASFSGLGNVDVHLGGWNTATLLMRSQQANADAINLKGRLNFLGTNLTGVNPGSVITLVDSNPDKTLSVLNYRPAMDTADVFIGVDGGGLFGRNAAPLAFGSPASVSQYINSLPDGSSWKERLTSSLKSFTVPVQLATFTFATLPVVANGSEVYCSDCNLTCTAGGSTGRVCFRENGAWTR